MNNGLTYKYKGKEYKILSIAETKHPQTREWYKSVNYEQLESGNIYNREYEEFIELFKVVKE